MPISLEQVNHSQKKREIELDNKLFEEAREIVEQLHEEIDTSLDSPEKFWTKTWTNIDAKLADKIQERLELDYGSLGWIVIRKGKDSTVFELRPTGYIEPKPKPNKTEKDNYERKMLTIITFSMLFTMLSVLGFIGSVIAHSEIGIIVFMMFGIISFAIAKVSSELYINAY